MSKSEGPENTEGNVVSVTKHGQATIPKEFRDALGIEAPGKVRFRMTDDGDVVVERVPSASEMVGFADAEGSASTDTPASELLREKRERDKESRDDRFDESTEE